MWLLLIMFLNAPEGLEGWHYLEKFTTLEECLDTIETVDYGLLEAYGIRDFKIKCTYKGEVV